MNDAINIGAWILVFPIASLFTAAVCVYLSISNRRYRTMAYASSDALHEAITIIDALASRGVIVCDECHRPIAPRTPTAMELRDDGKWSIAHRGCVEA